MVDQKKDIIQFACNTLPQFIFTPNKDNGLLLGGGDDFPRETNMGLTDNMILWINPDFREQLSTHCILSVDISGLVTEMVKPEGKGWNGPEIIR